MLTTLTKELVLPRFLERDEAERAAPIALYPWDGVTNLRPFSRLAESVAVLKGCFGPGPFSFAGEHYTITDYDAQPKPVQQPNPPFFIGGGGRTTLELAAREAQTVGLAPRILRGGRSDPRSFTWAQLKRTVETRFLSMPKKSKPIAWRGGGPRLRTRNV